MSGPEDAVEPRPEQPVEPDASPGGDVTNPGESAEQTQIILHVGMKMGGRYILVNRLAIGGMGEVWKAVDIRDSAEYAIKVLRPELAGQKHFLQRLQWEARNASQLRHPNLAWVVDNGEDNGLGWVLMELVEGTTLSEVLKNEHQLPAARVLPLMYQAAQGLAAIHKRGIIHRDIKPGNLMITPRGRVKITDFGISRGVGQTTLTAEGMVMGTAQYLAPEQAIGNPATASGDLYALGVVGYEALAGRRPFTGESQVEVAAMHVNNPVPPLPESVPTPVRTLIMNLLDKDPHRRPRNADALMGQLADAMRRLRIRIPKLGKVHTLSGGTVPAPEVMPPSFAPSPTLIAQRARGIITVVSALSQAQPNTERDKPAEQEPGLASAPSLAEPAEPAVLPEDDSAEPALIPAPPVPEAAPKPPEAEQPEAAPKPPEAEQPEALPEPAEPLTPEPEVLEEPRAVAKLVPVQRTIEDELDDLVDETAANSDINDPEVISYPEESWEETLGTSPTPATEKRPVLAPEPQTRLQAIRARLEEVGEWLGEDASRPIHAEHDQSGFAYRWLPRIFSFLFIFAAGAGLVNHASADYINIGSGERAVTWQIDA